MCWQKGGLRAVESKGQPGGGVHGRGHGESEHLL